MNRIARSIAMLAVGLTLGLLLSLAWRPQASRPVAETRRATPDSSKVWLSIDGLENEQRELRTTLATLRQELTERQQAAVAGDQHDALRQRVALYGAAGRVAP